MPYTNPASLLGGQNMAAFLDVLAYSEGTSTVPSATTATLGRALFHGYDRHPRIAVLTRWGWSDAAGRYQIMAAIPGRIRTDT